MNPKTLIKNKCKIDVYPDGRVFRHSVIREWDKKVYPAQWLPVYNEPYPIVNIRRKSYKVHRLMAEAFLSDWKPTLQVDHINGDKTDNRIENLRMVSPSGNNSGFQKKRKNTTSQYRGVSFKKHAKKWCAAIQWKGVYKNLGYHNTEIEAAHAYNNYAKEIGAPNECLNNLTQLLNT